jgi:hypothetical protein
MSSLDTIDPFTMIGVTSFGDGGFVDLFNVESGGLRRGSLSTGL